MSSHRLFNLPFIAIFAVAAQAREPDPEPRVQARPWPEPYRSAAFTVGREGADLTTVAITSKQSGKKLTFKNKDEMHFDSLHVAHNGWPQVAMLAHGPPEFLWRKLYRVEDGAYRCVRIDELARYTFQAPPGAPVVEISHGGRRALLRTRDVKEGDPEFFEAFSTKSISPDGQTRVRFNYQPRYLSTVAVGPAKDEGQAQVIWDVEENGDREAISRVLWRPDSGAFAFHVTRGPRLSTTTLFVRQGGTWATVELPELTLPIAKDYGYKDLYLHIDHIEPMQWVDASTLVLAYWGHVYYDQNGNREPGDYSYQVTFQWDKDGKARLLKRKMAPEPNHGF